MCEGLSFVVAPSFMRSVVLSSILFVALQCLSGSALAVEGRIEADGPDLVLKLDDGRILRREALVGLRLVLATRDGRADVRISEFRGHGCGQPPAARFRSTLSPWSAPTPLPAISVSPTRTGDGPASRSRTAPEGSASPARAAPKASARSWDIAPGTPGTGFHSADLHRACIHMFRADYGGDDHPSTRNGTLVDVSDRFGIQKPEMPAGLEFEAAWGPDGAVCVAHPRIAANISLEDLAASTPASPAGSVREPAPRRRCGPILARFCSTAPP